MLDYIGFQKHVEKFREESGLENQCANVCKYVCECDFNAPSEYTVKNVCNPLARLEICDAIKMLALRNPELIEAFTEYDRLTREQFTAQGVVEIPDGGPCPQKFDYPEELHAFLTPALLKHMRTNLESLKEGELLAEVTNLFNHTTLLEGCDTCPNNIKSLLFEFYTPDYAPITHIPTDAFTKHLIRMSNRRLFFTPRVIEEAINPCKLFQGREGIVSLRLDSLKGLGDLNNYEILFIDPTMSHTSSCNNIGRGFHSSILFTSTQSESFVYNNDVYYAFPNYEYLVKIKKPYFGNVSQHSILGRLPAKEVVREVFGNTSLVLYRTTFLKLLKTFPNINLVLARQEVDQYGRQNMQLLKDYKIPNAV